MSSGLSYPEWKAQQKTISRYRRAWGFDRLDLPLRMKKRRRNWFFLACCVGAVAATAIGLVLL